MTRGPQFGVGIENRICEGLCLCWILKLQPCFSLTSTKPLEEQFPLKKTLNPDTITITADSQGDEACDIYLWIWLQVDGRKNDSLQLKRLSRINKVVDRWGGLPTHTTQCINLGHQKMSSTLPVTLTLTFYPTNSSPVTLPLDLLALTAVM